MAAAGLTLNFPTLSTTGPRRLSAHRPDPRPIAVPHAPLPQNGTPQFTAATARSGNWRLAAGLVVLLTASPAWAYIDPNAGGWLYQLLFPLLVGIGALWAGLRLRIRAWWHRLRHGKAPAPQGDEPGDV
jgi:hypothetical protein